MAVTRASVERLKTRLQSMRADAKHASKVGIGSLVVVGGGAACGVIQAKMPFLPGTQVPTSAALGTALVAAAMSGMLDEQSDNVAAFGSGMLAALAAKEAEKIIARAA